MMRATSASHRTESSYAFFNRPFLRLANVTCLLILFSILFSSTLPLPILLIISIISLFSPSSFFFSHIYISFFLFSSNKRKRGWVMLYTADVCRGFIRRIGGSDEEIWFEWWWLQMKVKMNETCHVSCCEVGVASYPSDYTPTSVNHVT